MYQPSPKILASEEKAIATTIYIYTVCPHPVKEGGITCICTSAVFRYFSGPRTVKQRALPVIARVLCGEVRNITCNWLCQMQWSRVYYLYLIGSCNCFGSTRRRRRHYLHLTESSVVRQGALPVFARVLQSKSSLWVSLLDASE